MDRRGIHAAMPGLRLALFFVLCGLLFLAAPGQARAATINVTTLQDENDGIAEGTGCSLREALYSAQAGDVIEFAVSGTITLTLGGLNAFVDLSINGPADLSVTIDGDGNSMLTLLSGTTCSVSNLVFQNGDGGCIRADNNTTITNCTFRDSINDWGGAVYSDGGNLTIESCLFENNQVTGYGGALIVRDAPSLVLNDCAFRNNSGYNGGGAAFILQTESVTINRCEFSGNTVTLNGGAMCIRNSSCRIINSTFSGNTARLAGALYIDASVADISFCTIAHNSAESYGGLYFNSNGSKLKNTIISDNEDIAPGENNSAYNPDLGASGDLFYEGAVLLSDITGASLQLFPGASGTLIQGQSALLEPLADNGGPTMTHALGPQSPAHGQAEDLSTLDGTPVTEDQRLAVRPQGGDTADIGAYESDLAVEPAPATKLYTGWWWQGDEYSGTGISIEDQGLTCYLAWYGYDETGQPVWYSALAYWAGSDFRGDLYRYDGWPLEGDSPGDGYEATLFGPMRLSFTDTDNAELKIYTEDYTAVYVWNLVRYWEGEQDPRDIQGWWYDPIHDGMGVFLEARDGQLFGSWYHYRDDESPRWWITLGAFGTEDTQYTGPLGEYSSGQTLTGAYQPATLESATKGPVQIDFLGDDQASMTWQGITYNLERFSFGR